MQDFQEFPKVMYPDGIPCEVTDASPHKIAKNPEEEMALQALGYKCHPGLDKSMADYPTTSPAAADYPTTSEAKPWKNPKSR